jgi:PAS domain S-box-containing protein
MVPGLPEAPPDRGAALSGGSEVFWLGLADVVADLNSTSTLVDLARLLAQTAARGCSWDDISLFLQTEQSNREICVWACEVQEGKPLELMQPAQRLLTAAVQKRLSEGEAFVLGAGEGAISDFSLPLTAYGGVSAFGSTACLPLRVASRTIAFLVMRRRSGRYEETELEGMKVLAGLGAGALSRIQGESLLQRREELYRRAIGGVGAVPYAYDYQSRLYLFIGEGIEQLIGYKPGEVSGELWGRIIRETAMRGEAAGLDKQAAAQRVREGDLQHWRCDMRVTTKDGKTRWISDASVQNYNESGKVVGSMGILQDVTERKQAELSALAFSRLGRGLLQAVTAHEVGRVAAQAARELCSWDAFGFHLVLGPQKEVVPVIYYDTIDGKVVEVDPPPGRQSPTGVDQRLMAKGGEIIFRPDSGAQADSEAVPFGDVSRTSAAIVRACARLGNQAAAMVSIHSYTPNAYTERDLATLQMVADYCGGALERIRAGEALRKSESQLRLVWENSEDGMRLTDARGMILKVNEAYCRMVGKPRPELEGASIAVVQRDSDQDRVLADYLERAAEGRFEPHVEAETVLWDGRRVWFDFSNSLLEVGGEPSLLLSLVRDVTVRKQAESELEQMHRRLIELSRQAGMAEVATSVLHNVGNVLNSVNISSSIVAERVRNSKIAALAKAMELLEPHRANPAEFLSRDPKGRQLLDYLSTVVGHLVRENKEILQEMSSLGANVEHINEIVSMQQNYAMVAGVQEILPVASLVEDALRLNAGAIERHRVKVVREFAELPPILVEKHKVLQILVNLIRNAKYALDDAGHDDKRMTIRVQPGRPGFVEIVVADNGIGIPAENLTRIFEHGFTTRKKGHGFGLHNGALTARELGGALQVESPGLGQGAKFTLELPARTASRGAS